MTRPPIQKLSKLPLNEQNRTARVWNDVVHARTAIFSTAVIHRLKRESSMLAIKSEHVQQSLLLRPSATDPALNGKLL